MEQKRNFRWQSHDKFYAVLLFGLILVFFAYDNASYGEIKALLVSLIGMFLVIVSTVTLAIGGVWIQVGEDGIMYRNLFGVKTLNWEDVSHSHTMMIKLTKTVYIKTKSGKSITLPIVGAKATEISKTINGFLDEQET